MGIKNKFLAAAACVCALAIAPVALGAGVTVKVTPTHQKEGKKVEMLVTGMKPNERVKAHEVAPNGQTRNLYPRAGHTGALLVRVTAQVKGKHVWTFTGRSSHRKGKGSYIVT